MEELLIINNFIIQNLIKIIQKHLEQLGHTLDIVGNRPLNRRYI
jgi:hypothetical protein